MTEILFTDRARHDLRALDQQIARRIVQKIHFFSQQKNPLRFAKRITDPRLGSYRFRVGDYRILFDIDAKGIVTILLILAVKHRSEAYIL